MWLCVVGGGRARETDEGCCPWCGARVYNVVVVVGLCDEVGVVEVVGAALLVGGPMAPGLGHLYRGGGNLPQLPALTARARPSG